MRPLRTVPFGILCLLPYTTLASPLQQYVQKPEPHFHWRIKKIYQLNGDKVYLLQLTSQKWHGILWQHDLSLYLPKNIPLHHSLPILNVGGKFKPKWMMFALMLAKKIHSPTAILHGIPNQPLLGGKKEDALIAETFVRYLQTKDPTWPLLFPMVKSVVKCMDALQELARKEFNQNIRRFIVLGSSKRGWTSWLSAAVDPRIHAIIPMVIDTLNMHKQIQQQYRYYHRPSEKLKDYRKRKLLANVLQSPLGQSLLQLVDPYSYRQQLTANKLIINGTNDPYWTVDSLNLYWKDLPQKKWILYVPNAGHGLRQKTPQGHTFEKSLQTLSAFLYSQIHQKPFPTLTWHFPQPGTIRAKSSQKLLGGRLWVSYSPTMDFRKATWKTKKAYVQQNTLTGKICPPKQGYLAYFAEVDLEIEGRKFQLSTQIQVLLSPELQLQQQLQTKLQRLPAITSVDILQDDHTTLIYAHLKNPSPHTLQKIYETLRPYSKRKNILLAIFESQSKERK
ncbi:MAG: hypothetical protein D6805_01415 [Planctomycetota bacterium]|nr:MAG: hypothetical protein D6805_01415 [Planctomycetota bacterium]